MAVKMYDGLSKEFRTACQKADVQPTRRQYKKWLQRKGKAWEHREVKK